jgi:hypothetical protein
MTLIEEAINGTLFPDFTVHIIGDGVSLTSVLTQGISFNAQVDWTSDSLIPEKMQEWANKAAAFANKAKLTSASGLNEQATLFKWASSQNQTFSLPLIFSYGAASPLSSIKQLNKLAYPKDKGSGSGFYTAPMGYMGGNDKAGLLQVTIGTWFRATDVVCTSNSFEVDSIFDENGKPALATCTVNFSANKLLTADEFSAWFLE